MTARRHTPLAWLQRVAAGAILTFWIVFWLQLDTLPSEVRDYELNFILPDLIWIAGLLFVASRSLIAGDRRGFVYAAAAGGALVFLGILDVMFNLRHGQYTVSVAGGALNVVVNAGCLLFGLWNIHEAATAERRRET